MGLLESLITGCGRREEKTFPQTSSASSETSAPSGSGLPTRKPEPSGRTGSSAPTTTERVSSVTEKSVPKAEVRVNLPDAVLTARHPLATLCQATLDANPATCKLSADERRGIAAHLEAAVLNWLSCVLKPEPAWDAECPKGHRITDGIFAKVLMGWCCGDCGQVYAPNECKLRSPERVQ